VEPGFIVLIIAIGVLIWASALLTPRKVYQEPIPGTKWTIPTVGEVTVYDVYADTWGNRASPASTICYQMANGQRASAPRSIFLNTASPWREPKVDPREDPEYQEFLKVKREFDKIGR
jgi:hypothetical protein